jgi:hypothetical protein
MRLDGHPITREGFLDYGYLGDPPSEDRIGEDTLPPQFRHGYDDEGRRERAGDAEGQRVRGLKVAAVKTPDLATAATSQGLRRADRFY